MFTWIRAFIEAEKQTEMAWQAYATQYDIAEPYKWYIHRDGGTTSRDDTYWAKVASLTAPKLERKLRNHKVSVGFDQVYDKWDNLMRTPYLVVT